MNVLTIPAAVQRPRGATPRVVVLHDPGQPLDSNGIPQPVSARGVANFNATPPALRNPQGTGGYHSLTDHETLVLAVPDENRCNGAAGANDDGLHHCFCDYTLESLTAAAAHVTGWASRYGIPLVELDATRFNQGAKGIVTHATVEVAIGVRGGHTDPRHFPMPQFLALCRGGEPPKPPEPPKPKGHELTFFFRVPDAATDQGRKDVYVSNGIVYERTTPDQLKALQFVAGAQGLPTTVGTMTKAQLGNMERVGP